MARCVYTVKFGLTVGDSVVLMVQGGYVSTGGPKHGCGSAWNLSERPTLSDRAKHRPDGAFRRAGWVTEVQSRSDAEARGAAAYVCTPCLQNPCLGKRWPVAHQIGAAEAEAGTAPPRQKDKQRQGEKRQESQDSAHKQQDGGVRLMQMCSEMSPNQLPPGIVFICFPQTPHPPAHRPTYACSQMFGLNFTKVFHPPSLIHPYL